MVARVHGLRRISWLRLIVAGPAARPRARVGVSSKVIPKTIESQILRSDNFNTRIRQTLDKEYMYYIIVRV